jgi:hypothetical protein
MIAAEFGPLTAGGAGEAQEKSEQPILPVQLRIVARMPAFAVNRPTAWEYGVPAIL